MADVLPTDPPKVARLPGALYPSGLTVLLAGDKDEGPRVMHLADDAKFRDVIAGPGEVAIVVNDIVERVCAALGLTVP